MYYNTDGIPSSIPNADKFWINEFQGNFIFKTGDITSDIDILCVKLRNEIAKRIFGSLATYYKLLPTISMIFPYGGIDAEVKISKEEFEKFIGSIRNNETANKILYFYDCENVISTLQNGVLETKFLVGQFYKMLNENSFLINGNFLILDDGLQFSSGMIVTNITSLTNHIFINLYSQLDFLTKAIYEFENLHNDFRNYPRLKSHDILFGDKRRISLNGLHQSLFEDSIEIKKIISLRNEIVHNSSIDSIPKVYQVIKAKKIVEKFILLPDFQDGLIKTFKNRKRFFDDDIKLNEILPTLVIDFWRKLKVSLDIIK